MNTEIITTIHPLGFLYDFVKRNEKKKGSQLKLSSNEMKGLKAYKENYKEGVAEMHKAIKGNTEYYALEVYKTVSGREWEWE